MNVLIEHTVPIAIVLAVVFGLYVVEFLLKKSSFESGRANAKTKGRIAVICSLLAAVLNLGLCTYLMIMGAEMADVFPIVLLALLKTLL